MMLALSLFQFALPRGERPFYCRYYNVSGEFQFALPRGERRIIHHSCERKFLFQFALPRGERRGCYVQDTSRPSVSIRAPARGATSPVVYALPLARFQFALPRGERPNLVRQTVFIFLFQFALPRGERQKRGIIPAGNYSFQFALPRGERPDSLMTGDNPK